MIKIEHVILPSPEQMEFVIEGMRNPMNSWNKSDSGMKPVFFNDGSYDTDDYVVGDDDFQLMQKLSAAGTDHRKFMRMMPVMIRITAPLYWWKEFDTYKVGTVANSCSTMHKIAEKEFTLADFSCEHLRIPSRNCLIDTIKILNSARDFYLLDNDKEYWWQMIQLLPSSYNQTRNVMCNYECLKNMYRARKTHKLDEWVELAKWIETQPYSELITESQK